MASEIKKWIEIKGKFVLFEGNTPIRVATKEESIELEYKSSVAYKVSRMNFKDLLTEYTRGLHNYSSDAKHTMEIYYKELLRRGYNL